MKNYSELAEYLLRGARDFNPDTERQKALNAIAGYIQRCRVENRPARLNFICTHNSRRSHFGQVMAQVLAAHLGLKIETFSGGTEATAFHPNAVKTLRGLGVDIEKSDGSANPHYRIITGNIETETFSKVYSENPNPKQDFAAVMVCSSADAGCPFVAGAEVRISLPFEDPKISDGTPGEEAIYRNRALEIGTEIAWAFLKSQKSGGISNVKI